MTTTEDALPTYNGYLTLLKALVVQAMKNVFDDEYPVTEFQSVHVSIEYPIDKMNYPGIWVDYSDTGDLVIAGVDHKEYNPATNTNEGVVPFTRWKFQGYVSYTIAALTSLERDRLYDEVVRILAFGKFNPVLSRFREYIEANPLMAANMNFDKISPQGNASAPGTPWGTDEIIYERTLNMEIIGEFVSDNSSGVLLPLSAIVLTPSVDLEAGETRPNPNSEWH